MTETHELIVRILQEEGPHSLTDLSRALEARGGPRLDPTTLENVCVALEGSKRAYYDSYAGVWACDD